MAPDAATDASIRKLVAADLGAVARIDARHTGEEKPRYWEEVFDKLVRLRRGQVAIAAEADGRVVGYLLGEVRAFEFGSEPCGWIFAVGVEPDRMRHGIAARLLDAALDRFRALGVSRVRTMVRRSDVPVLSFFRSVGFEGGSFVQLEREIDAPGGPASGTGES